MKTIFPESALAHKYLDGLSGLEIGASAHNPFGLRTRNVDIADEFNTDTYKKYEVDMCAEMASIDIIAPGDALPVPDESQDFVIHSHVLEHFPDPIKALQEWYRVIRPDGYVFMIIPHKERTFDRDRPRTTLDETRKRHAGQIIPVPDVKTGHYSFWITEDLIELVRSIDLDWSLVDFQDVDDKVGNGFTIVLKKGTLTGAELDDIEGRTERLERETRRKERIFFRPGSFPGRVRQILGNALREFRRNGIRGIIRRGAGFLK
jgi:SAM-dependent methyltransferase